MNARKTALFRQTLAATGCLAAAARAAEISLEAARRLRAQPVAQEPPAPDDPALELATAVAALEAEAVRRALSGVEVPVFHQGRECGSTVKHSDTLLMFLLKTLKPERYGGGREAPEPGDAEPGEAGRPPVGLDLGPGAALDGVMDAALFADGAEG